MDAGSQQSQLDTKLRQYQALIEVAESIAVHRDLSSLLQDLAQRLQLVVKFDVVNVVLHDPEHNSMQMNVLESPSLPGAQFVAQLPVEESPSGWVRQTQQPLLITDLGAYQTRYPRMIADLKKHDIKTVYLLPLTSAGRRLGALGFGSLLESAWSEADQGLLQEVAKLVAIAVDSAINFETAHAAEVELKRRLDHLRLMLKITNEVVSQLDLWELLRVITSSIREAIASDTVGVGLFDYESGQLRTFANDVPPGHPLREKGTPIPLEGNPAGLAFTSGQPVFLDKPDFDRYPSELMRRLYQDGYRSGGSIPLIAQGRKLGVLGVSSKRENAFSDDDKELLCQVAKQVAIAVDNALNFERAREAEKEIRRQLERERLMLEINNAVVSNLNLPELLAAISESLRPVLLHDFTGMALYDPDCGQLRVQALDYTRNQELFGTNDLIPLKGTAPGKAFTSRKMVILRRLDPIKSSIEMVRRAVAAGFKSSCHVPLISRDQALGTLDVMSFREDAFTEEDTQLLTQIGRQIAIAVENALSFREIETLKNKLASEKLYLEDEIRTEHNFEELIGESRAFKRILKQVETVAPTDSAVLIRGETGTGKELIARAIHSLSARRERTLVKINCAAIPMGLLESELFGHEKGAFTGAITQRIGRFELAHKGTLLLDEVGDIPLELQPKLLRVLQEQEFERLGSTRTQRVDVRLIAATNSDLEKMVADKKYRSDLYYRLNVFPITIPPLRERAEDIPALARFFTQKYARRLKKRIEAISAEAMAALTGYHWPGNVRELEHFIERAVVLTQGSDLEVSLSELKPAALPAPVNISTLEAAEREHILRALEEANWVVGGPEGAAARLGMKRTTLQSRMQKLGIERPQ